MQNITLFFSTYTKLFFLLTPFFVISTFLSMTQGMAARERKGVAIRATMGIIVATLVIYLFGNYIFSILGITVDSFRIGAGVLLFLSAVTLVSGTTFFQPATGQHDIAIVPLALPVTVGPGTTGTLLVLGAEMLEKSPQEVALTVAALLAAVLTVGVMLYIAAAAEKFLRPMIMSVLTKLTGLVLASLSAQLIFTGIRNFMK